MLNPSKPLQPKEVMSPAPTIEAKILDELADGQWHPLYKIRKNIKARYPEEPTPSKDTLKSNLDVLVDKGKLRAGNNESFRFHADPLQTWWAVSESLDRSDKQYHPRWFGGILEDDGWLLADLKIYDLIHFRASLSTPRSEIMALTKEPSSRVQVDEEGLFRVFTTNGAEVYEIVKQMKADHPEWEIAGIRLEKDLKRRDIEDLPPGYMSALCEYYGSFAKRLLRNKMTSIVKHLPEYDDIQQQIYLWIIDAVQRYDATTSIPFGAYLGTVLANWVHNLNRRAYGRGIADIELRYSRAVTTFKAENGRDPRPEELAVILEKDTDTVKRDMSAIHTVASLRNTGTIHREEGDDLSIPSEATAHDNIDMMVENTLLSAAITTATERLGGDSYKGFIGIYYQTWGHEAATKKLNFWLKQNEVQESINKILTEAQIIMRDRKEQ